MWRTYRTKCSILFWLWTPSVLACDGNKTLAKGAVTNPKSLSSCSWLPALNHGSPAVSLVIWTFYALFGRPVSRSHGCHQTGPCCLWVGEGISCRRSREREGLLQQQYTQRDTALQSHNLSCYITTCNIISRHTLTSQHIKWQPNL
jgi:hypothetical protein